MKDLYIVGAGGFGREVAWLVERINDILPIWNFRGFIDDNETHWGTTENDYPVLGGCDYLLEQTSNLWCVCAVGSAKVREKIISKLSGKEHVHFATLVDPSVLLSKSVQIGEGTIICAGTIITVDVKIGNHVIINLDCTLGHDDVIEDFITIYPCVNVSGNVTVGKYSELETGMQIIQEKKVAPHTIIGAGAVVVNDIKESGTYVGCPAKRMK